MVISVEVEALAQSKEGSAEREAISPERIIKNAVARASENKVKAGPPLPRNTLFWLCFSDMSGSTIK
jgi:hypothetical protein